MPSARTSARWAVTAGTALALVAVTASPVHALQREIGPDDGASGDQFGTSVAMDGDTLVVGAAYKSSGRGAVYVYNRTANETWTQSAKLLASDGISNDAFGYSVAIDGDVIVVGAPGDDANGGSLYLYNRTGSTWTQGDHLFPNDRSSGDAVGTAVDIDGSVVVAGAPSWDGGLAYNVGYGAVYTFDTVGVPGRFQTARLTASDNTITGFTFAGSALGSSIAIDGDTIVAGAPRDYFGNVNGPIHGSVYTFARTGATPLRQETAKLTVTGQPGGRVGESVDIEGDTIVAGDSEADSAFGAAWLFTRNGAVTRNQVGKLTPASPSQNKQFGASVSISTTYIAVGAPSFNVNGSGFVFTRTGTPNRTETWYTSGGLSTAAEKYGASIVTDGDRVVGGAPYSKSVSPTLDQRGRVYSATPTLFVTKNGTGTGTITADLPGTACGSPAPCFADYLLGDQVTLTATANPGSFFAGWANYSPCTGSTTPTCVVTMDREPQVVATFTTGAPPNDTTPPTLSLGSGPAQGSTITTSTATFGFSANETSTFTCSYDGAAFTPCTAPGPGLTGSDTRSGLTEGPHTFKVRATDTSANHNVSVEQTRTFTVDLPTPPDTVKPQTTITAAPKKVKTTKRKASVAISFKASETSTFICSIDGGAAKACTSPASFKLKIGKHTIVVTAIDAAGNRDATPAQVVVKVKKKKKKK